MRARIVSWERSLNVSVVGALVRRKMEKDGTGSGVEGDVRTRTFERAKGSCLSISWMS